MFEALLPKGAPFFELLLKQNSILCSVCDKVVIALESHTEAEVIYREIGLLEEEADVLHVAITRHLLQTFITPIDREDILHIDKAQEEAIDLVHNMANRLFLFEFETIRFPMRQLSRVLRNMTELIRSRLEGLSRKKDNHDSRQFCSLRGDCEMLLSIGLAELFDQKTPTPESILDILKWQQAYDRMEVAVNQVVVLAEAIEEAVLKNA